METGSEDDDPEDDSESDEKPQAGAITVIKDAFDAEKGRGWLRLQVQGRDCPLEYKARAKNAEDWEEKKKKKWDEAAEDWRRMQRNRVAASSATRSSFSTRSSRESLTSTSSSRPRRSEGATTRKMLFEEPCFEGHALRDCRLRPDCSKVGGGTSFRRPCAARPTHVQICGQCGVDQDLLECGKCPRAFCVGCYAKFRDFLLPARHHHGAKGVALVVRREHVVVAEGLRVLAVLLAVAAGAVRVDDEEVLRLFGEQSKLLLGIFGRQVLGHQEPATARSLAPRRRLPRRAHPRLRLFSTEITIAEKKMSIFL